MKAAEKKEVISFYMLPSVVSEVVKVAKLEKRSLSQMAEILLEEALWQRKKKKP